MTSRLILLVLATALIGCTEPNATTSTTETLSATPTVFNAAGAPIVMFSVPDMVCESCSAAVHETLAAQAGAKEVTVDLEKKVATVAVDEATFDEDAAIAALLDKQFSHAKLIAAPEKPAAPEAPPAPEPSEG